MKIRSNISFFGGWGYKIFAWMMDLCRDAIAIMLFGLGVVTFLSCLTYSADDPSFLQATEKTVGNIFGLRGSTYADFVLQTLGYAAYMISALFMMWGAGLFRGRIATSLILRLMYMPPVLLLCAASLEMLFGHAEGPAKNGVGGHLGQAVAATLMYFPEQLGSIGRMFTMIVTSLMAGLGLVFLSGHGILHKYTNKDFENTTEEEKPVSGLGRFMLKKKVGFLFSASAQNSGDGEEETEEEHSIHDTASPLTDGISKKQKSVTKNSVKTGKVFVPEKYELPALSLLQASPRKKQDPSLSQEILKHNAQLLEGVLEDFGVKGEIKEWHPGPVVTLYELEPAAGIRSSRVIGLADDIARAMSAIAARVAVIPGKNAIGIELPNTRREIVYLKDIIDQEDYQTGNKELPLALGKDIGGISVVADLAKMPHLLIAGTTGSGKSVGINTMILSLLYKLSPQQCKMIMIDPKMLELSIYDGIPHLLAPVVVNPKKAVCALKWVVREMEERYDMMSKTGVRKLSAFNSRIEEAKEKGEVLTRKRARGFDPATGQPVEEEEIIPLEVLPYIVVIVDEMADLMMVAGKEIEGLIQRLAQMARAAGIHLITATQRPSVDVITGTIKANFPTRISFQVTSKIDSRTILGEMGAEQLLGQGDMLFMESGGRIRRVHGAFVSDKEVEDIVAALKAQGEPNYIEDVTADPDEEKSLDFDGNTDDLDPMFAEAVEIIRRDQKVSTSYIQRKLKIGYNRAARIIEEMEEQNIISSADHTGKREIVA